jgi:xanthine dehydrogenase accessory factor
MNEHELIARTVCEYFERCSPIVLISMLTLKGSTPRHEGSKMAVSVDGRVFGTIGGSLLEATAIEKAKEVINTGQSKIFRFNLTGDNTNNPDMILRRIAEVLLEFLEPTRKTGHLPEDGTRISATG